MTKEEALKVIRHMAYLAAHVVENGVEAYECIEQLLSQPSLPSEVNEAAIQAHIRLEAGEGLSFLSIFKAGARWMAEQGESIESTVVTTQDEDICRPYLALQNFGYAPAPIFCKEGDKVIVQIRKS